MPEALDVIRLLKRIHQTREFTDAPVSEAAVSDILEVARWTGSARNVQPWHFVVIEDRKQLADLAAIGPSAGFFGTAPLVIGIVIDQSTHTPAFDEARVVERIFIAAAAHGLSAGLGTFRPDHIAVASATLKVPDGFAFHAGVAIGTATPRMSAGTSSSTARKPLESIVHYGTYGGTRH